MFSFYHKDYNKLYTNFVELSRQNFFYQKFNLKDRLETRVMLIFLHLSIVLIVLKNKFGDKDKEQKIYDNVFQNIEYHFRELGHGDVSVNNKMKQLNRIFYDILLKIGAIENKKFKAQQSIMNKYFKEHTTNELNSLEMCIYAESFYNFCFDLDIKDIISGNINFKYYGSTKA